MTERATVPRRLRTPPARARHRSPWCLRPTACVQLEKDGRRLNILEVKNPDLEAQLVRAGHAEQLAARVSFHAMRGWHSAAQRAGAKGIRVQVSGRLGGAEMSCLSSTARAACRCTPSARTSTTDSTRPARPSVASCQGVDLQGRYHRARVRSPAGRAGPAWRDAAMAAVAPPRWTPQPGDPHAQQGPREASASEAAAPTTGSEA